MQGSSGAFSAEGSVEYEEKQKSRSKSITSTARMETTGGIPPSSNDPEDPLAIVKAHTKWADSINNEKNLVNLYQTVGVWSAWTVIYDLMDKWIVDTPRKQRVRNTFLGIQLIAKDETEAASLEQIETKLLVSTFILSKMEYSSVYISTIVCVLLLSLMYEYRIYSVLLSFAVRLFIFFWCIQ